MTKKWSRRLPDCELEAELAAAEVRFWWSPLPGADPYEGSGRFERQDLDSFRAAGPRWEVPADLIPELASHAGCPRAPWIERATLAIAVIAGDLAAVKSALSRDSDPDGIAFGERHLVAALEHRRHAVALALLDAGADPMAPARTDPSLLHVACRKAQGKDAVAVVRRLVAAGLSPELASRYGATPLINAAYDAGAEVVGALLALGARVEGVPGGKRPLSAAVALGNTNAVHVLLKAGAAIDAADEDGETPLRIAVSQGHAWLVTRLIELGASTAHFDELDPQTGKPRRSGLMPHMERAFHAAKR